MDFLKNSIFTILLILIPLMIELLSNCIKKTLNEPDNISKDAVLPYHLGRILNIRYTNLIFYYLSFEFLLHIGFEVKYTNYSNLNNLTSPSYIIGFIVGLIMLYIWIYKIITFS